MAISGLMMFFFVGLVIVGVPIGLTMFAAAFLGAILGGYPLESIIVSMVTTLKSFTLMAIPFYLLAGNLMNTMLLTERIFSFAESIVGHIAGGLAHANVLASMIFAGMSGSGAADVGGLGLVEIKAMNEAGFERKFSIGVTLASATVGPIIPPSIPFIIYAVIAQVSILKIFIAGLIPGILISLALMIVCWYVAKTKKVVCPKEKPFKSRTVFSTFYKGFFAILAPLVILGGMMGGIMTPTEAGVIAVFYCLFCSTIYNRKVNLQDFWHGMGGTVRSFSTVMFFIAGGSAMSFIFSAERVPILLLNSVQSITDNRILLLILINIFLLILGCFMDGISIMIITLPLLLGITDSIGVDRVQFGVIMTLNMMIGMITPPVGINLFVVAGITDASMEEILQGVMIFYIPLLISLFLITFVPEITLWLPNLLGL